MRTFFITVLAMSLGLLLWACASDGATVKQTTLVMPTYDYSDPDPVAHPDRSYYPYYSFEGYSAVAQDKEWQAIELENPYIKVTIMPQIGGKIWGAVEKRTGNEFIYFNHVVKFRQVAMRGPWTSGGIELNFGIIGHAPTTSSAVDYAVRENKDGSVSCFLGALEQITGAQWCVEVKLEKDKAYFTTTTHWDNPSGLVQPYYQWMNAGYSASDDLKFFFPGDHYIGHEGDAHAWPIDDKGRHLDEYARNNFGSYKSYHVLGGYSQFYGAYWADKKFGSVHHSAFEDKLGMKIWIWGLSRQGMIWEDLLTDSDGQYVELQSGKMFNQPSAGSNYTPFRQHAMEPYYSDSWSEYWYPVVGTQGISQANAYGALYVQPLQDSLKLYFSPAQDIDQPLEVFLDGESCYKDQLQARCLETWVRTMPLSVSDKELKVVLGNGLLVYSNAPEERQLGRPMDFPADFDWNSVYGLYVQGQQSFNTLDLGKAKTFLQQCLDQDPYYAPALCVMADIHYRTADYPSALTYSRKALALNTYDPYANYIYALACVATNQLPRAKAALAIAQYTPQMEEAAAVESGKIMAMQQQWEQLEQWTLRQLTTRPESLPLQQLLLMSLRNSGQTQQALQRADAILEKLPLTHVVRFEKYLLEGMSSQDFLAGITNELPDASLLWVADWYEGCGAIGDALKVMEWSASPMAYYRRAFLSDKTSPQQADSLLLLAQTASAEGVMPSGRFTLQALQWAHDKQSGWPTDYYIGLLQWHYMQKDAALESLLSCGNDVPFAPFFLCRSQLLYDAPALEDLLRSERLDKSWRVGRYLVEYYLAHDDVPRALEVADEYVKRYPSNDVLGLLYAQSLLRMEQYAQCVDYLMGMNVLPNEGAVAAHEVYRKACLGESLRLAAAGDKVAADQWSEKALLWPENLGSGKPYDEAE